eukprot:tig00020693_g13016.t1
MGGGAAKQAAPAPGAATSGPGAHAGGSGAAGTGAGAGDLKLIGWVGCPFTQRVWLALHARGIKHEFELIDGLNKPEWFLKLNPKGQVRLWVEWAGSELHPAVMALLRAKEEADRPKLVEAIADKLRHLAAGVRAEPIFRSPTVTLVDCALVPILQRLEHVGRAWRGHGIPDGARLAPDFEPVWGYFRRLEAHPAVQRASFDREAQMDYYTRIWLKH